MGLKYKSELDFKRTLYFKYRVRFGEEEIARRLGLKDWEIKYFHGLLGYEYGKFGNLDRGTKEQDQG